MQEISILIVEDDKEVAHHLQLYLSHQCKTVDVAFHGKEAFERYLNHQWRAPLNTLGANFLKLHVLSRAQENAVPLQEGIVRCEEIVEQISQDLERF